ncbi:MAG: thioredoxin family protein [Promethearchaeota archaeon]
MLEKLRDEKLFKLIAVDLDQNRSIGEIFGINAIPTLLFFKDGKLLEKNIIIQGQQLVRGGIMVGAAAEPIIREIVSEINRN